MSSRDAILGRIRNALAHEPPRPRPPVPQVWPRENPNTDAMADRFVQELGEVFGEAFRLPTMEDARKKLAELAEASGWTTIGALDRPLCHELLADVAPDRVAWAGKKGTVPICAKHPRGRPGKWGLSPFPPWEARRAWPSCRWAWSRPIFSWPTPVRR